VSGLLFYSRDPGATNQLVAVSEALADTNGERSPAIAEARRVLALIGSSQIHRVGRLHALAVWRAAHQQCAEWDEVTNRLADVNAAAASLFDRLQPAGLVTGLDDVDEPRTVALWQAALARALPVLVFADNGANLALRCRSSSDGRVVSPTRMFVHDLASTAELTGAGISADRIVQTANLHLARIARLAMRESVSLRATWGVSEDAQIVLFASENVAEMVEFGRKSRWSETEVVTGLLARLYAGGAIGPVTAGAGPVALVIRPHPRDRPEKYDSLIGNGQISVIVSSAGSSIEAIRTADVVVGVGSGLLDEARILGQAVIFLTPGPIRTG
jgi:hypothetical protein